MKAPDYTAPPLVGPDSGKTSFRQMLTGHLSSEAYYEAHRDDNGVYILWMEFSRFGRLYAYPCVLQEMDGATYVFRSGSAADNEKLIGRWNELVTKDSFARFTFQTLKKKEFNSIYSAYRHGEAE